MLGARRRAASADRGGLHGQPIRRTFAAARASGPAGRRPAAAFGAAGILALYAYGAALYGAFHLADHPVFLGLAAYMASTSCPPGRPRRLRMPVLQAALCASLMWAAVEKWAYPQWTLPLLEERPWLLFGLLPSDFMVVAGFVEFASPSTC